MRAMTRFPGRPYPKDIERRRLVKAELGKRDMTITELARAVGVAQPHVSSVLNGVRRSKKTEEKIATFFGKKREELFPMRSKAELEEMRKAERAAKHRRAEGAA